jgi:hypothetical protein
MAMLRVLSGVLSASSAGLALAERIGVSPDDAAPGATVQPRLVLEREVTYPSQSESAALLDAALGRVREETQLAREDTTHRALK